MNNRELSASWILLANSKSNNFNDFRSNYPGEPINGSSDQPQTSLRLAWRGDREKTRRSAFARVMQPLTA
jgi:hypothetical protein